MDGTPVTAQRSRGRAAALAAEALLRALGGNEAHVRQPAAGITTGPDADLGRATIVTQEVRLAPVALRPATAGSRRRQAELLVASTTLEALAIRDSEAAREFFLASAGITVSGRLLHAEGFSADEFAGVPYLYRVFLRE